MWCIKLQASFLIWKYRLRHWIFQWKTDQDGDVSFVLFNRLAFTKYKEHTQISLQGHKMKKAGKWQGYVEPGTES